MKPISITLVNFGSFVGEHTLVFPNGPGLYFMYGDNQAEPRLEGNAAGKSTVWKALTWLFFGKNPVGLKAGDVANWEVGKKAAVRLKYEIKGAVLEVERTWSPNSWTLIAPDGHRTDLAKDPTNACLEELGVNFDAFVQTIVLPQDSALFLDLKAGPQAELFSAVMKLDRWIDYSSRASDKARLEDTECRRWEREHARLVGGVETLRATSVEDQLRDWEASRRRRLKGFEDDHARLVQKSKALKAEHAVTLAESELLQDKYNKAVTDHELKVSGARCPTCGQSTAHEHPDDIKRLRALECTVADLVSTARHLLRDVEQAERTLDRIESDADAADKEVNPYATIRDNTDKRITALQAQASDAKQASDAAMQRFSIASAWVRWFKDIRLAQIGDALEQLEIEVNNQVTALGLVDWELRFDVDKETRGGSVTRGFSVLVRSPHNTKLVPWESWSGGERQRLVVAGQMGLANLVRARTGSLFNLEVWDEPTKGMSPQGVQDLLEALCARAEREHRQIWIVDHRTLGFNKFAGTVKVIKTVETSMFDAAAV